MAKRVQLRRGTTAQTDTFTGALGELTYDTEKKQLRVHDGSTVGGKVVNDPTPDATETVAGKAKIATTATAQAGVNDTDFLTPLKLRNALNANGSAPVYACRAWVDFNGTGTLHINGSGNIASITDNGVGDYTLNFIVAQSHDRYAISTGATEEVSGYPVIPALRMSGGSPLLKTVSAVRISTRSLITTNNFDINNISVQVFC